MREALREIIWFKLVNRYLHEIINVETQLKFIKYYIGIYSSKILIIKTIFLFVVWKLEKVYKYMRNVIRKNIKASQMFGHKLYFSKS